MGAIKDLQKEFLAQLGTQVQADGYKPQVRLHRFVRPIPIGQQILHINIGDYHDVFTLAPNVAVRHDELERLCNELSDLLTEKEKLQTASIGAGLAPLRGVAQIRWTVASADDIPVAVNGVYKMFKEAALPQLERFTTLEDILALCSRDDPEARLWGQPVKLATRAIGAAFLLGRRDELDRLVEHKTHVLRKVPDRMQLPVFLSLAEHLTAKWESEATKEGQTLLERA